MSRESAAIRPGGVMVTMYDASNPLALKWTLSHTSTEERDVVVISVRMMGAGGPEYLSAADQSFSEHEQMVFTKAISVAESFGKKVSLLLLKLSTWDRPGKRYRSPSASSTSMSSGTTATSRRFTSGRTHPL